MYNQMFTVRIRRDIGEVKPESERTDGKDYMFRYGWEIDDKAIYLGETAWVAIDPNWPKDAPSWIASGDLVPVQ